MDINVAGFEKESVVDGEGIRFTVFLQGCPHHCKGCHNPNTWDFSKDNNMPIDVILARMDYARNSIIQYHGLTLSGGEPFCQPLQCCILADKAHSIGWSVWCYTGYTYEELLEIAKNDTYVDRLLRSIDTLVDGPYMEDKKDLDLVYRGSSNQRVLRLVNGSVKK